MDMDIETTIAALLTQLSADVLAQPSDVKTLIQATKWKMMSVCACAYGSMDMYDRMFGEIDVEQKHDKK